MAEFPTIHIEMTAKCVVREDKAGHRHREREHTPLGRIEGTAAWKTGTYEYRVEIALFEELVQASDDFRVARVFIGTFAIAKFYT